VEFEKSSAEVRVDDKDVLRVSMILPLKYPFGIDICQEIFICKFLIFPFSLNLRISSKIDIITFN